MPPSPLAISPGSVTCFFLPRPGPDAENTASLGCAIAIADGVSAAVVPGRTNRCTLNGEEIDLAPTRRLVAELSPEPVELHLESNLPLGCGFGVSAAATLSAAFALDRRFDLGLEREALGMAAHRCEVLEQTGLGDVAAQLQGGVVHRHCSAGPLDASSIEVVESEVWIRVLGPLSTATILSSEETMARIQKAGAAALAWLHDREPPLHLATLLRRSRQFVKEAGLDRDPAVRGLLDGPGGEETTMALLGRTLISAEARAPADAWPSHHIDFVGTRFL